MLLQSFRYGIFCMLFGVVAMLQFGCDDDGPTAPDPTATPTETRTPAATPTETPTETPTPAPENRDYYGTSYRNDTGEAIGEIEYVLFPDGLVSGKITMCWSCRSACYEQPYEVIFTRSFSTYADSDGHFWYYYLEGGSPSNTKLYEIKCEDGSHDAVGTWRCWRSLSTEECGGSGTWTARCWSGC